MIRPADKGRRVLLVAPQSFFAVAGTPFNVLQMCRSLTEAGYEVHLATLPGGETVPLPNLTHHRAPGLPGIARVPVGFSWAKAVYDVLLCLLVLRLLIGRRFIAIHAVEEAAFFAIPLARLFGTAAVMDLDSDICGQLRQRRGASARLAGPAGALRRWSLRTATCAVTVAPALTHLVAEVSPGTPVFEIADTPLDAALQAPSPAEVAHLRRTLGEAEAQWIVYTGNLDARQGVERLVEAMPRVLDRRPDAALLVVGGEAEEVRRLEALAARLGVGARVRCVGKHPPASMPAFMALAAALVSPRLEPLVTPLKIFSYMASGRPIVATDLPTHTAVLDDRTAILVPPTSEGLAGGILAALEQPERAARLGEQARRAALSEYGYDRFKRQMLGLYAFVAPRAGRAATA
ncbi:MAG TPA: glycosyltransferase family 4 protein [Azospirillum sp.]|nr:glycosyltransferase family 4 protein [Azospirillum sp.]